MSCHFCRFFGKIVEKMLGCFLRRRWLLDLLFDLLLDVEIAHLVASRRFISVFLLLT